MQLETNFTTESLGRPTGASLERGSCFQRQCMNNRNRSRSTKPKFAPPPLSPVLVLFHVTIGTLPSHTTNLFRPTHPKSNVWSRKSRIWRKLVSVFHSEIDRPSPLCCSSHPRPAPTRALKRTASTSHHPVNPHPSIHNTTSIRPKRILIHFPPFRRPRSVRSSVRPVDSTF